MMNDCIEEFDFEEAFEVKLFKLINLKLKLIKPLYSLQAEKSFLEVSQSNTQIELTKTENKIDFEDTKWPIERY